MVLGSELAGLALVSRLPPALQQVCGSGVNFQRLLLHPSFWGLIRPLQVTLVIGAGGEWLSNCQAKEEQERPVRCLASHIPVRNSNAFHSYLQKVCCQLSACCTLSSSAHQHQAIKTPLILLVIFVTASAVHRQAVQNSCIPLWARWPVSARKL